MKYSRKKQSVEWKNYSNSSSGHTGLKSPIFSKKLDALLETKNDFFFTCQSQGLIRAFVEISPINWAEKMQISLFTCHFQDSLSGCCGVHHEISSASNVDDSSAVSSDSFVPFHSHQGGIEGPDASRSDKYFLGPLALASGLVRPEPGSHQIAP